MKAMTRLNLTLPDNAALLVWSHNRIGIFCHVPAVSALLAKHSKPLPITAAGLPYISRLNLHPVQKKSFSITILISSSLNFILVDFWWRSERIKECTM
jgi:hypothetical protein